MYESRVPVFLAMTSRETQLCDAYALTEAATERAEYSSVRGGDT